MSKKFRLEEITAKGRVDLGELANEPVVIGREPDYGIAISSEAVSGEHGVFLPFRGHWFYKDLGSTNGSWVNGNEAPQGIPFLIREGDSIQVADRVVRFSEVPGPSSGASQPAPCSLILVSRGELVDEFPVPEVGKALVIGGSKADFKLDIDIYDLPSLVIEARGGGNVVGYSVAKEIPIYLNGRLVDRSVSLKDKDEVAIEHYRVILNDPPPMDSPQQPLLGSSGGLLQSWDETPAGGRTMVNLPFGKEAPADRRDSAPIDEHSLRGFSGGGDSHPAMRSRVLDEPPPSLDMLTDKIIIIVGSLLLIALVGLVLLWALG